MSNKIATQPHKGHEKPRLKWQEWGPVLIAMGPGYGPHFLKDLAHRRDENESIVVVIYGGGGSGKTYFGLTTAMILDPEFTVERQVLFSRQQLMDVISNKTKIDPGQALVIDESQFSVSARTWGNVDQVEIMQHLAALRSRNLILFIIILGTEMLDKIIRNFTITHKVFMLKRGVGRVYSFEQGPIRPPFPKTLSKDCVMPLPDSWPEIDGDKGCENPHCLRCHHSGIVDGYWEKRENWDKIGFKPCLRQRSRYERLKKAFLEGEAAKSADKHQSKLKLSDETRRLALTEAISRIPLTDKNHLNLDSIMDEVEKATRIRPRHREAIKDRLWYETTFPEAIQAKKLEKRHPHEEKVKNNV
jgi:hypothetical protein